jgi:hypothetical protein
MTDYIKPALPKSEGKIAYEAQPYDPAWVSSQDAYCEAELQSHADACVAAALAHYKAAAPLCDKHQPDGGARSTCLVCGLQAQSAALSKISYLCGPPNEMECGPYDVHCNEEAVIEEVREAVAHSMAEHGGPVAWVNSLEHAQPHCVTDPKYCSALQYERGEHLKYIPLYAAPQAPLAFSDEQIDLLWRKACDECKNDTTRRMVHMFARAILAAAQDKKP